MALENILKHTWNKIYLDTNLPKNRENDCRFEAQPFLEFIVPTTKRKSSVGRWLGTSRGDIHKPKAVTIVAADILLFIPRLIVNVLKLVTEFLPLTLRELTYEGFNDACRKSDKRKGFVKGLYKIGAVLSWLAMCLFSLWYFIGSLVTSPGKTVTSLYETLDALDWPIVLSYGLSFILGTVVVGAYVGLIAFFLFSPLFLPAIGLVILTTLPELKLLLLLAFGLVATAMFLFNREPNQDHLFKKEDLGLGGSIFEELSKDKTVLISIRPSEFLKVVYGADYRPSIKDSSKRMPPPDLKMEEDRRGNIWVFRQNGTGTITLFTKPGYEHDVLEIHFAPPGVALSLLVENLSTEKPPNTTRFCFDMGPGQELILENPTLKQLQDLFKEGGKYEAFPMPELPAKHFSELRESSVKVTEAGPDEVVDMDTKEADKQQYISWQTEVEEVSDGEEERAEEKDEKRPAPHD